MKKYIYFLLIASLTSCTPQKQEPKVNTDVDQLCKILSFPYRPVTATWTEEKKGIDSMVPGPEDYAVVAVVKFSKSEFDSLKAEIEKTEDVSDEIYLDEKFVSKTFLGPVRDVFRQEGNFYRVDGKAYSAERFFRLPYLHGICVFGNNEYVLLSLYTM